MTQKQVLAFKLVSEWVFQDHPSVSSSSSSSSAAPRVVDDFGVQKLLGRGGEKLLFELHSHSKFSDGFFSPSKVVERAHINGVSFNILSSIKVRVFYAQPIGKYSLFFFLTKLKNSQLFCSYMARNKTKYYNKLSRISEFVINRREIGRPLNFVVFWFNFSFWYYPQIKEPESDNGSVFISLFENFQKYVRFQPRCFANIPAII